MKEIRRILKEETAIPENIDKAMEDVLSGILNSPDEKTTGALSKKTNGERTKNSGNKKKIIRILLPVAAILGVSTGVLATNIGRLYKELEQQGVAEQEAAQMVVTEPESTAENVENITSYPITPEAVDWNQSMLTVKEAYFDGGGLSFVGEPSNEAKNYMITCRDHATVNGKDALASLNKIEGEDLYYGHITLYDDALIEKILNEDSEVELSMTIQAYPVYDGKIYYTWKDTEAYEKIFKTGSFTDSEGRVSYALPAEDVYRGYTPQILTLTLPLKDEVRDIIEKYRKEGKLQAADTGIEPSSGESTQNTTDLESSSNTTSVNEKYDPEKTMLQVKENHVTASLPGKSGTLTIEADITGSTTDVSALEDLAKHTKAVCFGSLAQRSVVSRDTINRFIDAMPAEDTLKIFDINLRQGFYTKEILCNSFSKCNILKINDEELVTVSRMFGYPGIDLQDKCWILLAKYNLKMLILTCGVNGSYVFTPGNVSFVETPRVEVADTVGAGDSFTAAFVSSILSGLSIGEAHKLAVETSAYVCTQNGAMPVLPQSLKDRVIK